MNWFLNLPAGEQVALVTMVVGAIFNLGVYAATVRFLTKRVAKAEERLEKHDTKLEEHGEAIEVLKERTTRSI